MARKADAHIQKEPEHGKRYDQKMKPYLVLQYLMQYTDENNVVTAYDILAQLKDWGIEAERRSIYKDIEEINVGCNGIVCHSMLSHCNNHCFQVSFGHFIKGFCYVQIV